MTSYEFIKPPPDSGVALAVDQVAKHKKSKRIILFALRNLSELCSPEKNKYKENSLAAMVEGILPILNSYVDCYAEDEDITTLSLKILKSISDALLDTDVSEFHERFNSEFSMKTTSRLFITATGFLDNDCIIYGLHYLINVDKLKNLVIDKDIITGVVNLLVKRKNVPVLTALTKFFSVSLINSDQLTSFLESDGIDKLLDALLFLKGCDNTTANVVESAFNFLSQITDGKHSIKVSTGKLIDLIENFKSFKSITTKGSAILLSVIGPDELKKNMDVLKTHDLDNQEAKSALSMLASMSYITTYATEVVQNDGITLFFEILNVACTKYAQNSADNDLMRGIYGICMMLERISTVPSNMDIIDSVNGLTAFNTALTLMTNKPNIIVTCCDAICNLLVNKKNADKFAELKGYEKVNEYMLTYTDNAKVKNSAIKLFSVAVMHEHLVQNLYNMNLYSILYDSISLEHEDIEINKNILRCLVKFLQCMKDSSQLKMKNICDLMKKIGNEDVDLVVLSLEFFEQCLHVSGSVAELKKGDVVSSVLEILLVYPKNSTIENLSYLILRSLVTEEDVINSIETLKASVHLAKTNPDKVYESLAAISGLCPISGLKIIFEQKKATTTVISAIEKWVELQYFPAQQKLIYAATRCIKSLVEDSTDHLDDVLNALLKICLLPHMSSLIERQDVHSMNLYDIISCCSLVANPTNISEKGIQSVIDSIIKVSWKYQDFRKIQVDCITMLTELASIPGASEYLVESGAIKNIISYMLKVVIYEDVQLAGLALLDLCIKTNSNLIEPIKASRGVDVCKSIQSTYCKSCKLKNLLYSVASQLTPCDFLDISIRAICSKINSSIMEENVNDLLEQLQLLVDSTSTPDGCRFAINNRIGNILMNVYNYMINHESSDNDMIALALSLICRNLCATRSGVLHISRIQWRPLFETCLNNVITTDKKEQNEGLEAIIFNYSAMCKSVYSKKSSASKECKSILKRMCQLMQDYRSFPNVQFQISNCLTYLPIIDAEDISCVSHVINELMDDIKNTNNSKTQSVYIHILNQIFIGTNDERFQLVKENKILSLLFSLLSDPELDHALVKDCLDVLVLITQNIEIRQILEAETGPSGVQSAIGSLLRILSDTDLADESVAESVSILLKYLLRDEDKKILVDLGFVDCISNLFKRYSNNKILMNNLGVLLGKAIDEKSLNNLVLEIIELIDKKPNDWQKSLEGLLNRLSLYITAECKNIPESFENFPKLISSLVTVLKDPEKNGNLYRNISLIARRLLARFENQEMYFNYSFDPFFKELAPSFAKTIQSSKNAIHNSNFYGNAYYCFGCGCKSSKYIGLNVELATKYDLIPSTFELLRLYKDDSDFLEKVTYYLNNLGEDRAGLGVLLQNYPSRYSNEPKDKCLVDELLNLMTKFKSNGELLVHSVELLTKIYTINPGLLNQATLKRIQALLSDSKVTLGSLIELFGALMTTDHKHYINSELPQIEELFKSYYESLPVSDPDKKVLSLAYCYLIKTMAQEGSTEIIKKSAYLDNILNIIEDYKDDPEVFEEAVSALVSLADADISINSQIASKMPDTLTMLGNTVNNEPLPLMLNILELLNTLGSEQTSLNLMTTTDSLEKFLNICETEYAGQDPMNKSIQSHASRLLHMIRNVNFSVISLKECYELWTSRKDAGEELIVDESCALEQELSFVFQKWEEYCNEALTDPDSEQWSEYMYGCKCLSLINENPLNINVCIERNEDGILIKALKTQKHESVIQASVVVARDLCAHSDAALSFSSKPDISNLLTSLIDKVSSLDIPVEERDDMVIPRLELLERCAISRNHFSNVGPFEVLVNVWNDHDNTKYTSKILPSIFRAMRAVVNYHCVTVVSKNKVPSRIIKILADENQNILMFHDLLFLVGALSVVAELKNLIGEVRGVETCLALIKRCLTMDSELTNPVLTNACLATANLTIAHQLNISRFLAADGVNIIVNIIKASNTKSLSYDVINSTAVLICNICYKRDDMKKFFGEKGAIQPISTFLKSYDGSDTRSTLRCISSILKAIGNLALYTPNIITFLGENIETTFAHIFSMSSHLTNSILEVSLRAMSNIVLEYTEDNMKKFSVTLVPLLNILKEPKRNSRTLLLLILEVLTNLCRFPPNVLEYNANDGISITLKIMNTSSDNQIYLAGIRLFTVQITNSESVAILVKAGVFSFLCFVLQNEAASEDHQSEIIITSLRCIRRLSKSKDAVDDFLKHGGLSALITIMQSSTDVSMIEFDSVKILLQQLSILKESEAKWEESTSTNVDDEWDAVVNNEGIFNPSYYETRPISPRAWELLNLNVEMINHMILILFNINQNEKFSKQIRLKRCIFGLLSYFACEKIIGMITDIFVESLLIAIKTVLSTFSSDFAITFMVCTILANVSYCLSPQEYIFIDSDKEFENLLTASVKAANSEVQENKKYCSNVLNAYLNHKDTSPSKYKNLCSWNFDLNITEWQKELYPNGVQDLPSDIKKKLRTGGNLKIIKDKKANESFSWRSSQDLLFLQWKLNPNSAVAFQYQVPVVKIRSITGGLFHKKGLKVMRDDKTSLHIRGPISDDDPEGLILNLKAKNRKERDDTITLLCDWRDAASYGF